MDGRDLNGLHKNWATFFKVLFLFIKNHKLQSGYVLFFFQEFILFISSSWSSKTILHIQNSLSFDLTRILNPSHKCCDIAP